MKKHLSKINNLIKEDNYLQIEVDSKRAAFALGLTSFDDEKELQEYIEEIENDPDWIDHSDYGSPIMEFFFEGGVLKVGDYEIIRKERSPNYDGQETYAICDIFLNGELIGECGIFGWYSSWGESEIEERFYQVKSKQITVYEKYE